LFVFQRTFFRSTETSGVDSGIFCDRNFWISNPYEVSNEVSVERKPEKFSKFRAQINYCESCSFCKDFLLSCRNFGCWFRDFLQPKVRIIKSIRSFRYESKNRYEGSVSSRSPGILSFFSVHRLKRIYHRLNLNLQN
jgi:hypothetical protein